MWRVVRPASTSIEPLRAGYSTLLRLSDSQREAALQRWREESPLLKPWPPSGQEPDPS